jgi:cytochrome P450
VRSDDARRIGEIVDSCAREALDGARKRGGSFDAVSEYSRLIPLRLIRDYFGIPGPSPEAMKRWMRTIFWDLFLNQGDDPEVIANANQSGAQMKPYLDELIRTTKARPQDAADDFATRLLQEQAKDGTIDDDLIRRTIGGVIVGALDTQSKAIAHAIDELLRRPAALASARRAARANDDALVASHVWEALRFNPHNSGMFRHCHANAVVAAGTDRSTEVEKGSTVLLLTISAMFDPDHFERPDEFLVDRPNESYLHFGYAQHLCFGARIAGIVVPLAVKALLQLEGLSYDEHGPRKIEYEGPFPDRMMLRFDVPA